MKPYQVSAVRRIDAAPERVFDILADYRVGHPAILPKRFFTGLEVEQGGYGAGTVIRYGMRAAGRVNRARAAVTEPVPGRVLVETDLGGRGIVTTFTVTPARDGGSQVEFATDIPSRGGPLGALERWVVRRYLRRVYAEELQLLAERATSAAEA
jgi:uncharacterized protein YndB with AHSA1/START domain